MSRRPRTSAFGQLAIVMTGDSGSSKRIMSMPKEIEFNDLGMYVVQSPTDANLFLSIASGHADFEVKVPLSDRDLQVLLEDHERAAFIQAALHHPFQLRSTALSEIEQRRYLDVILHAPKADVEAFLTDLDHGSANGAISNMLRITRGRNQQHMREGAWFT
jgi:hypothetical protein